MTESESYVYPDISLAIMYTNRSLLPVPEPVNLPNTIHPSIRAGKVTKKKKKSDA